MATVLVAGSHAIVQYDTSASARTLAYAGALTVGSTLLVSVTTYANVTLTVSGSVNGAYTQVGGYAINGANVSSLWVKVNTTTTAETVTVTPSAAAYVSIVVDELTGLTGAVRSFEDGVFSATPITTDTVTATAGDLVWVVASSENQGISSVDSPFTLNGNLPASGIATGIHVAYHLSAAGNEAAVLNATGAIVGSYVIASFVAGVIAPDLVVLLGEPTIGSSVF